MAQGARQLGMRCSVSEALTAPGLSDAEARQLIADAEDLNGAYPDAVLFLARYAGHGPDASEAEIGAVDDGGVTLHILGSDGTRHRIHVAFEEPVTTLEQARTCLHSLFGRARSIAGDSVPLTSLEREIATSTRLPSFQTSVVDVEDLTPRLRQITFGGGLDDFTPAGPDQYLLVTPNADDGHASTPRAYYTVRRWHGGQIDMWFVLHGHGPLSRWAATATPGAEVSLWGPRTSFRPPPDMTKLLLVADDTGLPAVAAILEAKWDLPARVILETSDANSVELDTAPDVTIDWTLRGDDQPGRGTRLLEAVQRQDLDIEGLYAFGAGESRQISAVRKHLRRELGMPQSHVQMTGYWRHRETDRSARPIAKEQR